MDKLLLTLVIALFLVSCADNRDLRYSGFHFPYKLDLHQGNIIDMEKVQSLEVGMYKQQVEEVIGSPLLIDTFDNDHWIYVQADVSRSGKRIRKKLNLFFKDDKLVQIQT